MLVPGGFGSRGWEGKILACRVAREREIPYLGICLGMHVAVSEFARHVVGLDGANSTEMDPETPYPVIDLLPEQKEIEDLGGTMRLGAQAVELARGHARARDLRRGGRSTSATATATRSTTTTATSSSSTGSSSRGRSRRAGSSRSSSCPIIRGSSRASSTRSSSRARRGPRRSSASSSAPRSSARARSACAPCATAASAAPAVVPLAATRGAAAPLTSRCLVEPASSSSARSRARPGEERAVADRVVARARRALGLEWDEDGAAAPRIGSTRREHLLPAARRRRRRARRSSSARTSTPSPSRRRSSRCVEDGDRAQRGRDDPRRGQQGGRRGDARGGAPRSSPRGGRTRASSSLFTPKEEVGLRRRERVRPRPSPGATSGYVYDQAAPIGDVILGAPYVAGARGDASTAGRRTPACTPRRAAPRSSRPRGPSPTCGSAGSTRRRRANVGVDPRRHGPEHRPRAVHVRGRGALARRARGSREVVQEMLDACCVRRERSRNAASRLGSSRSYRGYRFRDDELAVRLAVEALARDGLRPRGYGLSGGGGRRERLQRARPPVRQPRERDDGHPHAGRADRGRRPRARWSTSRSRSSTPRARPLSATRAAGAP